MIRVIAYQKSTFTCEKRTICEVHREMFDILRAMNNKEANSRFELLVELLNEATTMAKKMSKKLYEHHDNVLELFDDNHNYKRSLKLRAGYVRSE